MNGKRKPSRYTPFLYPRLKSIRAQPASDPTDISTPFYFLSCAEARYPISVSIMPGAKRTNEGGKRLLSFAVSPFFLSYTHRSRINGATEKESPL